MASPSSTGTIQLGLERIEALLRHPILGQPHLGLHVIHVAGTNGKGSVCAFLDSILRRAGLSTGRFNSPHLLEERDSICLNGKEIAQEVYEEARGAVEEANRLGDFEASTFEVLTATALRVFAAARGRKELDVALVEVGLGGRTDATNVFPEPVLSVLTSIDLDHQKFLGDSVGEIAYQKAGIIKKGRPVVVGKQGWEKVDQVITEVASEVGSGPVWWAGPAESVPEEHRSPSSGQVGTTAIIPLRPVRTMGEDSHDVSAPTSEKLVTQIPLLGPHQLLNASLAALCVQRLRTDPRCTSVLPRLATIGDEDIKEGIRETRWKGRADWVSLPVADEQPRIELLLDGAHNMSSASFLSQYIDRLCLDGRYKSLVFVIALSSPRQPETILEPLLNSNSRDDPRSKIGTCSIFCTTFTPPVGMPWVKPVPSSDIHDAAGKVKSNADVTEVSNVSEAIQSLAIRQSGGGSRLDETLVVVCGSLYLIADVYRMHDVRSIPTWTI